MKLWTVLVGLTAMLPLTLAPTSANAEVPRLPIRCGMLVEEDAYLYLEENLYCPAGTGGVGIDYSRSIRTVTVDLRGHTLRGGGNLTSDAGVGQGSGWGLPGPQVKVFNGRIENWYVGVWTDNASVTNVKFVGNGDGLVCNRGCEVRSSYFNRNGIVALRVQNAGTSVIVRNTIFSRNNVGAAALSLDGPTRLDIRRSIFYGNFYGALVHSESALWVGHSKLVRNSVGVLVESGPENTCADLRLHRVKFKKNVENIRNMGQIC